VCVCVYIYIYIFIFLDLEVNFFVNSVAVVEILGGP
jgi:hypothetical protein